MKPFFLFVLWLHWKFFIYQNPLKCFGYFIEHYWMSFWNYSSEATKYSTFSRVITNAIKSATFSQNEICHVKFVQIIHKSPYYISFRRCFLRHDWLWLMYKVGGSSLPAGSFDGGRSRENLHKRKRDGATSR